MVSAWPWTTCTVWMISGAAMMEIADDAADEARCYAGTRRRHAEMDRRVDVFISRPARRHRDPGGGAAPALRRPRTLRMRYSLPRCAIPTTPSPPRRSTRSSSAALPAPPLAVHRRADEYLTLRRRRPRRRLRALPPQRPRGAREASLGLWDLGHGRCLEYGAAGRRYGSRRPRCSTPGSAEASASRFMARFTAAGLRRAGPRRDRLQPGHPAPGGSRRSATEPSPSWPSRSARPAASWNRPSRLARACGVSSGMSTASRCARRCWPLTFTLLIVSSGMPYSSVSFPSSTCPRRGTLRASRPTVSSIRFAYWLRRARRAPCR